MSTHLSSVPPGFVLESADSVRFGPEYTPDETERNRQMLFGEMLCGLLMGEQLWTNAVFAFDSLGTVEVLGAVSRAFLRHQDREQFMPFLLSVYPVDNDTLNNIAKRPWQNPGELFLRCYAHRLNNPGFILSATPALNPDTDRRKQLAAEICRIAETGGTVGDIKTGCSPEEAAHLRNILDIDRYFRSWLGRAVDAEFDTFADSSAGQGFPIRLNRQDWADSFQDGTQVTRLRYFLEKAACQPGDQFEIPEEPLAVLQAALRLPADHDTFKNRSIFRTWLKSEGYQEQSPAYRVLTELADGHYVRTQQSVLTSADREVTSPASQSTASQIGEKWASDTMRACLKKNLAGKSWQFINEIKAASADQPLRIDLDSIAAHFADYMMHPDRRRDLQAYHLLLAHARQQRESPAAAGSACMRHLPDFATTCCNNINAQLSRSCGVSFRFNTSDPSTRAGSLTFVYLENAAISQCTGLPQEVSALQSEGTAHAIHERP